MRRRLLWKLLLVNVVPVIAVIVLTVWLAIDHLAADYFMVLMDRYMVSPTETHRMFLEAVHRYLVWASLAALVLAFLLSYLLTRRVLRPLSQMAAATRQVAAGNFSSRVEAASGDEIGDLGAAFNRMADSLERLERLRKTMVADVAHELRTPLTNLRGYLEGLSDSVIPPSKATFEMLQAEVLRLVHLVDDLGQLARAEAARAFLDRRELSLPETVGQVLALYRPNFESRKYTPAGGRVTITADPVPDGVRVLFANSGPGIAEEDLPFVFERFFRGDRSRSREAGGAGIGLAIVKELIEAHGGRVGAESAGGETRVWFVLPR
jgi:signal transduction histidine kinase